MKSKQDEKFEKIVDDILNNKAFLNALLLLATGFVLAMRCAKEKSLNSITRNGDFN